MYRYLIILIIILLAAAFVVYSIFTFLFGISATKSAFQKDIDTFKAYLESEDLSPWNLEEVDILSRQGRSTIEEGVFAQTEKGVILSIYEEPILAYAVKTYRSTAKKSIAVRINEQYFHYELNGKRIFVFQNDKESGHIDVGVQLSIADEAHHISIAHRENTSLYPVTVNGRHVWSVKPLEASADVSQRTLESLSSYDDHEANLFLALLSYAIVDEQI